MIRVGTVLYGFCGGYFGSDSYEDKRVEAVGADWVVARDTYGHACFMTGDLSLLEEFLTPKPEEQY